MVAAYVHERTGSFVGDCSQHFSKPSRPILFALTNNIFLRQVSIGYALSPDPATKEHVKYLEGYTNPSHITSIPETDPFRGFCKVDSLKAAEVSNNF
jgi:hypothetical protein